MFYFAHCINIIFNLLLAQLVKYDVHITHKIKFIHAIIYRILFLYPVKSMLMIMQMRKMIRQTITV